MKKLLLTLITAVTISSNLLSMNTDGINLKLDQKPKFVPTYEWCKKIASEFIKEARQAIKLIPGREKDAKKFNRFFNQIRPKIETTDYSSPNLLEKSKSAETRFCIKALPEQMNNSIIKLLEKPYIKKKLGITKVLKNSDGVLIAERNFGPAIKFVQSEPPFGEIILPAFTFKFCVSTSTKFLSLIENNYEKFNETNIGFILHELGHIIHLHTQEHEAIIDNLYIEDLDQNLYNNFSIAQEIQADITGIFNYPDIALNQHLFFKRLLELLILNNISPLIYNEPTHPTIEARVKYLGEIYKSMLKDSKLPAKPIKEIKIQAPVQNQQAIINPAIIKKEPVVIKPVIINKQAPVSTQKVNKVSEVAKKYEKIAQDKKINNLLENKII